MAGPFRKDTHEREQEVGSGATRSAMGDREGEGNEQRG